MNYYAVVFSLRPLFLLPSLRGEMPAKTWKLCQRRGGRHSIREKKRTQTQTFWSGYLQVFHVKGWGPKSSVCPSKPRETKIFGGISRDFAGISRRCPKSLRKKSLCSIFVPYFWFLARIPLVFLSIFPPFPGILGDR